MAKSAGSRSLFAAINFGSGGRVCPAGVEGGHFNPRESFHPLATTSALRSQLTEDSHGNLDILCLSGGGSHGAWGTGVLCGWKPLPKFHVVTGVSTGALQATHAFLGEPQDLEILKRLYTEVENRDIFEERGGILRWFLGDLAGLITSNSMKNPVGLKKLIELYIKPETLKRVSDAYTKDKRTLAVGTVNLDTGEFHNWDLTEIAADDTRPMERRLALYHKAILASASIPIVFPPVLIEKEYNEKQLYMHVDGGVREQVFIRDALFHLAMSRRRRKVAAEVNVHVIVNGKLGLPVLCVENSSRPILERTIGALTDEALYGNLLRMYEDMRLFWKEEKLSFRCGWIPKDTEIKREAADFDKEEMRRLYDSGMKWILEKKWQGSPPLPIDDDLRALFRS